MIGLIRIPKRDSFEVEMKIHHQTIKVIRKDIFKSLLLCIIT